MEFDIPLPEELELLEANSYYPEEEDDDYLNFEEAPYPYPIDGDEEKEEEEESIAQKESNHRESESPDINGCKRPRSLVSDPIVNLDEASEKRIKINENRVEMEDEEWLRRFPVKEVVQIMEEEEEEVIPQETILSRYASEIDGECFPITAPDGGDRVYAKFSRALGDEEVKRFDLKAKSNVYVPSLVIPIHRRVAQIQRPAIQWPKSYHRCRTLLVEKQESLRSWHHKIPPYIGSHLSIKSFVEDSVSPLLHILSPPTLRPVCLHLLTPRSLFI
uniref:Uncharacterized protein n=1 Tax=Brassica campestris TaxID=3711 RepID=M4EP67_BRACM